MDIFSDTLSVLASTIGAEHFGPIAKDCVIMSMKLLEKAEDPDLKRCW